MCGACYNGITDVVGTSAPFLAGGVAVARHRLQMWLPFGRHADTADRHTDDHADHRADDHTGEPIDQRS